MIIFPSPARILQKDFIQSKPFQFHCLERQKSWARPILVTESTYLISLQRLESGSRLEPSEIFKSLTVPLGQRFECTPYRFYSVVCDSTLLISNYIGSCGIFGGGWVNARCGEGFESDAWIGRGGEELLRRQVWTQKNMYLIVLEPAWEVSKRRFFCNLEVTRKFQVKFLWGFASTMRFGSIRWESQAFKV